MKRGCFDGSSPSSSDTEAWGTPEPPVSVRGQTVRIVHASRIETTEERRTSACSERTHRVGHSGRVFAVAAVETGSAKRWNNLTTDDQSNEAVESDEETTPLLSMFAGPSEGIHKYDSQATT